MQLTITDVADSTGYTPKQLRNLCESGVLIPEEGGDGKGYHRIFSTMQVTALAYARQWAFSRDLVEAAFDTILDLSESELVSNFDAGRTHLIPTLENRMVLTEWPGDVSDGALFDLRRVYRQVVSFIEGIESEASGHVRVGRRRGAAS